MLSFVEVELCELLRASSSPVRIRPTASYIDVNFDSHALTEDPDELDGVERGASAEPPDVGVEYVDPLMMAMSDDARPQPGVQGVEVNGTLTSRLRAEIIDAARRG